jgi:hypothetical protein
LSALLFQTIHPCFRVTTLAENLLQFRVQVGIPILVGLELSNDVIEPFPSGEAPLVTDSPGSEHIVIHDAHHLEPSLLEFSLLVIEVDSYKLVKALSLVIDNGIAFILTELMPPFRWLGSLLVVSSHCSVSILQ